MRKLTSGERKLIEKLARREKGTIADPTMVEYRKQGNFLVCLLSTADGLTAVGVTKRRCDDDGDWKRAGDIALARAARNECEKL